MEKICISCGKEFNSDYKKRIYCSKKCLDRNYYNKHKTSIIEAAIKYQTQNPEKVKLWHKKAMDKYIASGKYLEAMKRNYRQNRLKWKCRNKTNKIINGLYGLKKFSMLISKCKMCESSEGLQIHHEIYVIPRVKEIKEAIINGKIYYLCKNCHYKVTKCQTTNYIN